MSTKESSQETIPELGTIWEVPDALWDKIVKPILDEFDPPKKTGRPRADQRTCLNGIIYRARAGCQWNKLPKEFGDDATVHRTLQRWEHLAIFDRIWALLIYHCEDLGGVYWEWQAADGCLNKARFIGKRGNSKPPKKNQVPPPKKNNVVSKKAGSKQAAKEEPKHKKARKRKQTRRRTRTRGSAPTPRIVESWASKTACLSRERAARLLS